MFYFCIVSGNRYVIHLVLTFVLHLIESHNCVRVFEYDVMFGYPWTMWSGFFLHIYFGDLADLYCVFHPSAHGARPPPHQPTAITFNISLVVHFDQENALLSLSVFLLS